MRFYVRNTFSTRGYRIYMVLSARLVKLYDLSAQHVKCGVLQDEHVQIWHSSVILTLQFYTDNRYYCT